MDLNDLLKSLLCQGHVNILPFSAFYFGASLFSVKKPGIVFHDKSNNKNKEIHHPEKPHFSDEK